MRLSQPLKTAGEHHLAVVGSDVFIQSRPGGIVGWNDEACARLDEPFEEVFVVRLITLREIIRRALKVGHTVAEGIAVRDGGIPKRWSLQNELRAKGNVADGVLAFATAVLG